MEFQLPVEGKKKKYVSVLCDTIRTVNNYSFSSLTNLWLSEEIVNSVFHWMNSVNITWKDVFTKLRSIYVNLTDSIKSKQKLFSCEGSQPFENMYFYLRSRMGKSDFFLLDVDDSGKQRHCYKGNNNSHNKSDEENLTWGQSFRMFPLNRKFRSTIILDAMLILIPRGYLRI